MHMAEATPADALVTALRRWLENTRDDGVDELSIARSSDGRQGRCCATGRNLSVLRRLASDGADESELARFEVLQSHLGPSRTGHWLEVAPGQVRRGWHFVGELPLERVRGALYQGWPNLRLGAFAARHGIEHASEIGHASVGSDGALRVRLEIPLRADAVEIALDAYLTFCVEPPPRTLIDELRGDPLALSLWFKLWADDAEVSLRVAWPDEPLIERCCRALGQKRPPRPVEALGLPAGLWLGEAFRLAVEHQIKRR